MHAHLRSFIASRVSADAAAATRIAYTGSVSAGNAASYRSLPDCDGFVCGRASLDAATFLEVALAGA